MEEKKKGNFWGILKLYRGYEKTLILVVLSTFLSIGTDFIYPILTHKIIDDVIFIKDKSEVTHQIMGIAICFVVSYLIDLIVCYIETIRSSFMADNIKKSLTQRIFDKCMNLSFRYYDNHNIGSIVTVMNSDVAEVGDMIYYIPEVLLKTFLTLTGAIIVFSKMSTLLMLITFPIIPVSIFFLIISKKKFRKVKEKFRESDKKYTEFFTDKLSGIRTIKGFGAEKSVIDQSDILCEERNQAAHNRWRALLSFNIVDVSFGNIYYILLLIIGSILCYNGKIQASDLITFFMYSYLIINPINNMPTMFKAIETAGVSYRKIEELLNEEVEVSSPFTSAMPKLDGNISFEDVSFRYDTTKEVFTNLNMNIQKGEYVAICGKSGLGKSTITNLLARYYDVTYGSIKIDGIDVRDFDLEYLHRNVGVVQQDVYLFSGTIYDNITVGVYGAKMEDVIRAAKMANCHEFISELPNGYHSEVGERGVKLSGGQKQRIAIARMFLLSPPVIIFDEVTSALDTESERSVQDALEKLSKGRTTIVIAHRLSTIQNADRILVMTDRGITEEGTHEELMNRGGEYAKLYKINK